MAPILSLCTGLIFALLLFWYEKLRGKLLYKCSTIEHATHIFVEGIDGNVEIVKLSRSDEKLTIRDTFVYRFIKFEYDLRRQEFIPVIFGVKYAHQDILTKFA